MKIKELLEYIIQNANRVFGPMPDHPVVDLAPTLTTVRPDIVISEILFIHQGI
jgi:hypothetical protein